MASITVRNLSDESKERLRAKAKSAGVSLESLARSILDQAAQASILESPFPHDLIALVEPGEDIGPYIAQHDELQKPIRL